MTATAVATIRLTTIGHIRNNAARLLADHFDEIATDSTKRLTKLQPDWVRYQVLESSGTLFAIAAFIGDEMVGYSVSFVHRHLHYSGLTLAQNDVLFVSKEHRNGRLGLRLIAETESEAKKRGARQCVWHAKQGTALDALLPRLGYGVQDILYSKELS